MRSNNKTQSKADRKSYQKSPIQIINEAKLDFSILRHSKRKDVILKNILRKMRLFYKHKFALHSKFLKRRKWLTNQDKLYQESI